MRRTAASLLIALVASVSLSACLPPNVPNPLDHLPEELPDTQPLVDLATTLSTLPGASATRHSWATYDDAPDVVSIVLDLAPGATPAQQAAITEAALAGFSSADFDDTSYVFELWSGELPFISFSDFSGTAEQGAERVSYVAQLVALSAAVLRVEFAGDAAGHVTAAKPAGDASRAILAAYPAIAALPDPAPGNWEWAIPGLAGSALPGIELASLLSGLDVPLAGDEFTYDAPITVGVETRFGAASFIVRVDDAFTRWTQVVDLTRTVLGSAAPAAIVFSSWEGTPAILTIAACPHALVVSDTDAAFASRLAESGLVVPEGAAPGLCLR